MSRVLLSIAAGIGIDVLMHRMVYHAAKDGFHSLCSVHVGVLRVAQDAPCPGIASLKGDTPV